MLGGAALWCLLFLNEAQPLRAVTVAADDPENVINEERKFADNGGVNHFTRASYIELRNRGPYYIFSFAALLPSPQGHQSSGDDQCKNLKITSVAYWRCKNPTFSNRDRANSIQDQDLAKPRHSGRQPQDIRPSQLHIYLLPRLDHYSIACILIMDIPGVRTKGVFLNERPIAMSSSPTGFRQ